MKYLTSKLGGSLASNILHLILYSSEQCNFRCRYCYEDFILGKMRPSVVRGVNNLLDRRIYDLDHLSISWFGGEPLLALDVIRKIHSHVSSIRRGKRLQFNSNINTNGCLLTKPIFIELLDLGIRSYQITFDGPREWHDRKRVFLDGRGTFDRIWENTVALRDISSSFIVVLRLHVDKDNIEAIPGFLDLCSEKFKGDRRFKVFIRPLSCLGGPNDGTLNILRESTNGNAIAELREEARSRGLADYSECAQPDVCYASAANSFAVRADGRVNKCTVDLDHPGNQVGQLNEDGTLNIDDDLIKPWIRGLFSGESRELYCPRIGLTIDSRGQPLGTTSEMGQEI